MKSNSKITAWLVHYSDLFDKNELSSYLGINKGTLKRFIKNNDFPGDWGNQVDRRINHLIDPIRSENVPLEPPIRILITHLVNEWKQTIPKEAAENEQTQWKRQFIIKQLKIMRHLFKDDHQELYQLIGAMLDDALINNINQSVPA